MKTSMTFIKKNKALLILPLALLPFVVLIFYILGGGENAGESTTSTLNQIVTQTGANYRLPGADRSIKIHDKMEAYLQDKSQTVSTHDYNITGEDSTGNNFKQSGQTMDSTGIADGLDQGTVNANISNDLLAHIKQKELQVRRELDGNKPTEIPPVEKKHRGRGSNKYRSLQKTTVNTPSANNWTAVKKTGIEELDKVFNENTILGRQNDSLSHSLQEANRRLKEIEARKSASFDVKREQTKGFGGESVVGIPIKAEVYETVTVLDGNRVKFRLLESCQVKGMTIPRSTFFYGTCKIKNERLDIHISRLPVGNGFLPVDLSIHDLDGLEGLYIPDNAARKVAKEVGSSTNTSSLFGVTANPLVYAGVRAADKTTQSLIRMVRLKKVTIKKNTIVYLIN